MGIFGKIIGALKKTKDNISSKLSALFAKGLGDDFYDELEEILISADISVVTAEDIVGQIREEAKKEKLKDREYVVDLLKDVIEDTLCEAEVPEIEYPAVIMLVGVNGVGKTTTIGKLAARYKAEGKKVILGAADTFRAAAIDQLDIWAQRAGVDIVQHSEGADPAAVVFDTVNAAKARDCDIVIIDTAGRLHNKKNLMDELAKIYRVIDRELPYSDREVLLVLDATTGQNAVNQAREFQNVAEITGIVLTKLDGTARGGVVLAIKHELGIPVKFIGVGEQIDDLQPFNPRAFAESLFRKISDEEAAEDEKNDQNHVEAVLQDLPSDGHEPAPRPVAENEPNGDAPGEVEPQTPETPAPQGADEAGVSELQSDSGEINEPEKPKKEKKRFGFFNRHA